MDESVYKFPVAPVQTALFFLNQIDPESRAYNIPVCVRLEGELDRRSLQEALDLLVDRHEILRTVYSIDDEGPVQIVRPSAACPLTVEDLSADAAVLERWFASRLGRTFDLLEGPLLYADLARISDFEHCLLLLFHHITVDHTAIGLFVSELEHAYRRLSQRLEVDLPEQELQYADYVVWLKENASPEDQARKVELWRRRLEGFSGLLDLPLDRPRLKVGSSRGAQYLFDLSAAQSDAVKTFSSARSVSVYLTLLSALKVLLHRLCRQDDVIVATPFANRGDQDELDAVMGCFINTLPLATDMGQVDDFGSLLASVKAVMLEAYDNQTVPFEAIVDAVNPVRDHSYNPIFQVGFVFQTPPVDIDLAGLNCTTVPLFSGGAMYDLHFWLWERDGRMGGLVWYNTDVFDAETVSNLVRRYLAVVDRVIAHPDENLRSMEL